MIESIVKMENIKTIIWDCDNTIWIHREDEEVIITKKLGIPLTEEFEHDYYEMLKQFENYFEHCKVTYPKIIKLIEIHMPILQVYGITANEFLKRWLPIETSFLNAEALNCIVELRKRGYKNIVLTDWLWDCQVNLLKKYGVLSYIDVVYTCDNQYLKKNPKSAQRIIKPGREKEYVIIGDSLKSDIAFANHAGIRSIWFNPMNKKNITQFIPTAEVNSLTEVCSII